jgi:GR25 family glycosyltransferase involved in LPS biosynthesis
MLLKLLNNYAVKTSIVRNDTVKAQFINNFPIYVINLKKDVLRRNYLKFVFKKHRINYKLVVVEPFNYDNTEDLKFFKIHRSKMGCILSHLWCINNAIKNNHQQFIIFEDDIIFHKDFENMFENVVRNNQDMLPDLLMLGSINFNFKNEKEDIVNDIYYPKTILGAHANMYKLQFATDFLNYKLSTRQVLEFDYDYNKFSKYKIGVCLPNLVVCELSTTNINHNFSPLNEHGFKRYIKCFPDDFTYNDYEYIIVSFIEFFSNNDVQIEPNLTFEKAVELFVQKSVRNCYQSNVKEWIMNGGYSIDDIYLIISNN